MKNKIILILALVLVLTPLSYAVIWSDESNINIYIISNKPVCQVGTNMDDTGWWENGIFNKSFSSCYREVVDSGSHGCCPDGYVCDNSTRKCVYHSAQLCSQYNNKDECLNYNLNVAKNDVESKNGEGFCGLTNYVDSAGISCLRLTKCACYWDQTANGGQGQCDSIYSINDSCNSSLNGVCSYTTNVIEKCNETGVIETIWTATWSGSSSNKPDTCSNGSSTIRCLSTALLPFIGIFAIIILIILVIIYYFLKKKNSRIKKKKR